MKKKIENKIKILIVDDDQEMCESFHEWLTDKGYLPDIATSGHQAIEKLKANAYNLILLDLRIPDMNGIEILKEVKRIDPEIVVIIITAYASLDTAIEAVRYGAYDYFRKPIDLEKLHLTISRGIEQQLCEKNNKQLVQMLMRKNKQLNEANKRFQEKTKRLKFLFEISRDFISLTKVTKLCKKVLTSIIKIFNAYSGSIILLKTNEEGKNEGSLFIAASHGLAVDFHKETIPKVDNGVAKWVLDHKGPLLLHGSLEGDPRFNYQLKREDVSSSITVPLAWKQKLIGVLCINIIDPRRKFTESDLELAQTLANQAAIAIENASLVNEINAHMMEIRKELEKTQSELIQSEKMAAIGQLAAGVAHEFNNLLNIIGGSAQYAQGLNDENEIKESLDVIVKSSDRGANIVKSLLTFARRTEPKKELADIVEVVEDVLNLIRRDFEKSSIRIARSYSDVPRIIIDIGQIQQVFLNIIKNARNAMPKGGKLIINLSKNDNFIKIQFHNTGKLIKKGDLPRLFTPFFTTRAQEKKGLPGVGLGLAISHGIIQSHGGTIEAESEKDKGTTFIIRLPIVEKKTGEQPSRVQIGKVGEKEDSQIVKADILIVDDESDICDIFKKVLVKEGHSVTVANNGNSAISLCKKRHFDLIFMDLVMPGIDGIETFKRILKVDLNAKIVFMTGRPIENKIVKQSIDKGAIDFLRKPVKINEIIDYAQNIHSKVGGHI